MEALSYSTVLAFKKIYLKITQSSQHILVEYIEYHLNHSFEMMKILEFH